MARRISPKIILICIAVLAALAAAACAAVSWYSPEKVVRGVYVYGVDFSGVTKEEGRALLAAIEKDVQKSPVTIICGLESWELVPRQVGIKINKDAVMENALKVGREKGFLGRFNMRSRLRENPVSIPLVLEVNQEKLKEWIDQKTGNLCYPPVEAVLQINRDDTVGVAPSQDGLSAEMGLLWEDLKKALAYKNSQREVKLRFKKIKPEHTTEKVESMGVSGLLSEFTTEFDSSFENRSYNIKAAAGALDGLLVEPEQEVSFNQIVGPRSLETGYKNAKVIINNTLVEGIGGGVCQVTSTLYNAALLAGLDIIERTAHSLPVGYVPIGRDATVVYQDIDLKFCNNTGSYLYIKSLVEDGKLTFKIYGNTEQKKEVVISSEIIEEIEPETIYEEDPGLPSGEQEVKQEGAKGFKVQTERVFLNEKGEITRRERFPVSVYKPVKKIIAVGIEGKDD